MRNVSVKAIEEFDDMLTIHFKESSVKFLAGAPYEDAVFVDKTMTWTLD